MIVAWRSATAATLLWILLFFLPLGANALLALQDRRRTAAA